MADSTGDQSGDECTNLQKQFLIAFRAHTDVAVKVEALTVRMDTHEKIHTAFEDKHAEFLEFQETLKPVLEAYQKGMTIKSRLGTIAMFYLGAMFMFPQLSPTSILSVIKMLL